MKRFFAVALVGFVLAFIPSAFGAGEVRGQKFGYDLTYALNGSLKHNQTFTDAAAGAVTESAIIPEGADVYIQCSSDTYVLNLRAASTDGGGSMVKILADQLYHVGLLSLSVPYVTIDAVSASTTCKIFLAY